MHIDLSELLPIAVAVLVAILAVAALFRVRRVAAKRLRIALLALTGLLSITAILVAAASLFFYLNYTRHLAPLGSPDGQYLAITTYTINDGTGADQAEVAIRHAWSPLSHRVYAGPAQYEPNAAIPEPALRWIDNTHLEIAFHTYAANKKLTTDQGCAPFAGPITILCEETRVHPLQPH